jgi:hypothetical protein
MALLDAIEFVGSLLNLADLGRFVRWCWQAIQGRATLRQLRS